MNQQTTPQQVRDIVTQSLSKSQFKVGGVPYHTHNGIDSPKISESSGLVSSVTASGSGITASPTTGNVVIANTGVTSLVAGTNISISGSTGAVTVSSSLTQVHKFGVTQHVFNSSGSQTIAHGFGAKPSYVRIMASMSSGPLYVSSYGMGDGTLNRAAWNSVLSSGGGTGSIDSSNIIFIEDASGDSCVTPATLDATNINLNWTTGGSPGGLQINILWEVW